MMSARPFLFAVAAVAMALGTTAATVHPAFASLSASAHLSLESARISMDRAAA